MMSFLVSGGIAVLCYLAAAAGLGRLLLNGVSCTDHPRNGMKLLGIVGLLFHSHVLVVLVLEQWISLSFFHALSITSWMLILLLELAWLMRPVGNLGVVIFPVAALMVALQILNPEAIQRSASSSLDTHILLSMLAYSLLTVAAIQAILLASQERHLRNKQPGGFMRALPPMVEMEHLMFQLIRAGLLMLTLAIFSAYPLIENLIEQQR
ncbi:MAG: cytochrome c biogenesis protein CcsA, partial [Gammaproteobacteria bacterium]|nr:cytochrome c biogenesis protein CcsA [Gammaproteobacteria bacterium]